MNIRIWYFLWILCFVIAVHADSDKKQQEKQQNKEFVAKYGDFVFVVEIQLRENKEKKVLQQNDYYYEPNQDFINNKKTLRVIGYAFPKKNIIITPLIQTFPNQFVSVTAISSSGKKIKAKYHGTFVRYQGDLFELEEDIPTPQLQKLDIDNTKNFYSMTLFEDEFKYYFDVSMYNVKKYIPFFKNDRENYDHANSIRMGLMLSEEGQLFGYGFSSYRKNFTEGGIIDYQNIDTPILTTKQLEIKNANQKTSQQLKNTIYQVQIKFRHNPKNPNDIDYYSSTSNGVNKNTIELKTSACLLNEKGDLIIAQEIAREHIERIEKINVLVDGKSYEANFLGLFQKMGAIMIQCAHLKGTKPKVDMSYFPKKHELCFTINTDKGDINSIKKSPARFTSFTRGYKDQVFLDIYMSNQSPDTFFINTNNDVIGFYSDYKIDEEDQLKSNGYGAYNAKSTFIFQKIKDVLTNPTPHFDKKAKPKKEEKITRVWLGVEVQQAKTELIEHLKATTVTQYGKIGYMVNYVYENSPAQKLGLKPLDILLSVTPKDTANEIFFNVQYSYDYRYPNLGWKDLMFSKFFSNRKGNVIEILTKLGEGREVTLKYFRDGKEQTVDLTLEKAPLDFEHAEKINITQLGINVKDLTYEVKQVMKMPQETTGVIISSTAPGQSASIAGIQMYEIITSVNGVSVTGAKHFQELVEASIANKDKNITFLVYQLNRSRIAKLRLNTD